LRVGARASYVRFAVMTNEERAAELDLTARVGERLKALGLGEHVALARAYYLRVQQCLPQPPALDRSWGHEMIVTWARTLRISPHEQDYPVRPRGPGTKCGCVTPRPYTTRVFPDGSTHTCAGCKLTWLELDTSA
jgi:hypothetical protein